jgi:hypothetical protein
MIVTRADVAYLFSKPVRLVRTILAMNVLGPIVAVIVCRFFALHTVVIVALVTLSMTPVGALFPQGMLALVRTDRGAYAHGLFVATTVLSGVGLTVLVVFLTLAELALSLPTGPLREILREGRVITGWVAMWRPLKVLLYDWWPLIDERRPVRRILAAPVSIRYDPLTESAGENTHATAPRNVMRRPASSDVAGQTT